MGLDPIDPNQLAVPSLTSTQTDGSTLNNPDASQQGKPQNMPNVSQQGKHTPSSMHPQDPIDVPPPGVSWHNIEVADE